MIDHVPPEETSTVKPLAIAIGPFEYVERPDGIVTFSAISAELTIFIIPFESNHCLLPLICSIPIRFISQPTSNVYAGAGTFPIPTLEFL